MSSFRDKFVCLGFHSSEDTLPNVANASTFAGNTQLKNVNDLSADSTIGGINYTNKTSGQNFSISGNRITLGGNIVAS